MKRAVCSLSVLALAASCASVPKVRPGAPRTLSPEVMTVSRDVARRVFESWTAKPVPSPCSELEQEFDSLAAEYRWYEYRRESLISAESRREITYKLRNGVTFVLSKTPYDDPDDKYPLMQMHVRDTSAQHDTAGVYMGVICDDRAPVTTNGR